ncbi:MAG: hypothetical protein ABEJ07_03505 [Candidatus Nanohaloarchaea archaeon]
MPEEEVDLGEETEDYEVVPVGPIRRLEKRIDNIETNAQGGAGPSDEVVRDVLDIMKSNQKIVNDMTESTHELKNEVEDLTYKMDEVVDNMNEFMDLLKEASEMDMEGEMVNDMRSRIADAVGDRMEQVVGDMQQTNQQVVESLEEINQSLKRSYAAQNKDEILNDSDSGGRRQGRSGGRRGLTDRSRERQQQGQNQAQGDDNGSGSGGGRDDRMRKLRNRFDKMDQDSERE